MVNSPPRLISMRNPKRQKIDAKWSKLCTDVLQMVLERLSPTDFNRAKAVCSAWLSASRESLRKQNLIPWLILFPYERSYMNSCRMLNPAEKNLVYRSQKLGVEFTQSRCIATCGSWLLMYVHHHQHEPKLYILNPLTRERISLPPLKSRKNDITIEGDPELMRGDLPFRREIALTDKIGYFLSSHNKEKARLWVDERSKDYIVFWSHKQCCIFFSKKGYAFWRMFPYLSSGITDFVYKDHMLYIYTMALFLEIYDFSGDSPVAVTPRPYVYMPPSYLSDADLHATRIAVSTTGEVLMVRCYDLHTTISAGSFYVYKMNHVRQTWDHMASLGDQALIFDLGITLPAKDIQGMKPNSIYFSGRSFGTKHIFIYNLATRKAEPFICSTSKFFDARWFIPNI